MFWWFERDGAYTRFEVLEISPGQFELRLIAADGSEHVELFTDANALAARQRSVEADLRTNGWTGPHGWVM